MSDQEWPSSSEDLRCQVEVGEGVGDGAEGHALEALEWSQCLSGSREKPESDPVKGVKFLDKY